MRTLLITDTETTGLDPATDRVIEVAAVLFDVDHATPIECFSGLMFAQENAAEAVNRIPTPLLRTVDEASFCWPRIETMVRAAANRGPAAFLAHRAEFDRSFYPGFIADQLPWVCSKFDIEWPLSKPGASLVEVALAHGVPVHDNHRALTDCMLLAKTLARVRDLGHDLDVLLARAMRPRARFVPKVIGYDAERNKVLKEHGFQWSPEKREWSRTLAKEDASRLPFDVVEVP